MYEEFEPHRFNSKARTIIDLANSTIDDYQAEGYALTVRQLFYQMVARQHIPNTQKEYDRLARIIGTARLAGEIDWAAIEDRTRRLHKTMTWGSPADALMDQANVFRRDLWADQLWEPECWIEKDALLGVIEEACDRYRVPYFASRGYNSLSAGYEAGKRFADAINEGRKPIVLHLGDHDPSGIDMTRDNQETLAMFARQGVMVQRLALNRDQVDRYGLPPNPTKEADARRDEYVAVYGTSSWELDALSPAIISQLITEAIAKLIDQEQWVRSIAREDEERAHLVALAKSYEEL